MMTITKFAAVALLLVGCVAQSNKAESQTAAATAETSTPMQQQSIHDFKVESLDGATIDFASFKGKKILVVNTASACGYTPQYKELEQLYQQHKENLVIVGFPANNFGGQEPGSNMEIKEFCQKNYGVSFPMAAKVSVKGEDMAPIYKWLTSKNQNNVLDATIGWNFNKFLIDENGQMVAYFPSKITPMSNELVSKL